MDIPLFRFSHVFNGNNGHNFSFENKSQRCLFLGHHWSKICQSLQDSYLSWGLHFLSKFYDFDLVSRSHVCQKQTAISLSVSIFFFFFFFFLKILVRFSLNVVCLLHTLKDRGIQGWYLTCKIYFARLRCVSKGNDKHVFGSVKCLGLLNLWRWDFLRNHKCDKY